MASGSQQSGRAKRGKERHLPISKSRKEELVAEYTEILSQSDGFVVVQTQGLGVSQVQGLRNTVREQNGRYLVAKNTLMRKALQEADWVVPDDLLVGPVAIVFGGDNMPGVSKALLKHMQDEGFEERMQVTGGVMAGEILDAQQVDAVSKLPTLDELRAQLAGLVLSPAQGVVNALHQATGGVVNVLQAYLDKHEDEAEAA
ncbi:MAG: 50S ribosomal protein L10 [Chloroflexi bacterium]|nr:50S ribosomal protein L10 [Chloroflexota bacterium]MXX50354.1 50S ribosomal protein L10 [Chloroflexota bacterium]MXX84624.1 50S ribosomal protein L10 [Chloroflexota bacterium]MYA94667.1 50S ribosomal protein L10 [Chloroflexota bacterium]MYC55183.1 50S ribosomal protein L10 [Chloroflexota bacterium]